MKCLLTAALLLVTMTLPCAENTLRVVPMRPTPESDNIQFSITFPKEEEVVSSGKRINFQGQIRGYPLGTDSDFPRAKEIYVDPRGQSLRVIIDELPPFGIYKTFVDSLDDNNIYYDKTLNKNIPYSLDSGEHIIRTFPVRSYGESIKGRKAFSSSIFYVGEKKNGKKVNLDGPLLTYNEPFGKIPFKKGDPVLLDFYISNTELSKDGYKVRLTVDKKTRRLLTLWTPYFLYGLEPGKHTIRLELIGPNNKVVPGTFNDVTKTIYLDN